MRVVFMGTPEFAVPTLERLCASSHAVIHVITQPDRPRGRGHKLQPTPVKALALARGIPVSQPETLRGDDVRAHVQALAADIGVVAAYGRIIPEALIQAPRLGMVNVHASLLPRWRGAAPIQRAVMAGDRETGVTIMRVVKALDAGAMLAVGTRVVGDEERASDVEADLARLGADLLVETLDRMAAGAIEEVEQPAEGITYAAKMTRDDSPIDWTLPARQIHDRVRGLHPWPLANTWIDHERLIVLRTRVVPTAIAAGMPGRVTGIAHGGIQVEAGDGSIVELLEVQPEGKRAMSAEAFAAGRRIVPGMAFAPPPGVAVIAPAREAAVDALIELGARRADLSHVVARMRGRIQDRRDAALAAEIVAGTVRWLARIDALLAGAAERPLTAIALPVQAVLRAAIFQIDHLDRVPAHAVVHDAVEQVRALGHPRLAGFVNAVLRRIADPQRRPALPSPPPAGASVDEQVAYLSIVESHPEWLVRRWLARDGYDATLAAVRFNNARPGLTVRVHSDQLTRDAFIARLGEFGIEAAPCRYAPDGVVVAANAHLDDIELLGGVYTIQDEGSQLVALAAGVASGHRVLDVCAAPGGKALAMATAAGHSGLVVAGDYRPKRVALLRQGVASSLTPVHLVRHDVDRGVPFGPVFDRVVVDAPCSGLGTLRRDPDIKWTRQEAELAGMAARQRRLLGNACSAVAPGGALVYATCSSEPDENEHVVDAFLAEHPAFGRGALPRWMSAPAGGLPPLHNARGELATHPSSHGLEAFFAAVLVRVDMTPGVFSPGRVEITPGVFPDVRRVVVQSGIRWR